VWVVLGFFKQVGGRDRRCKVWKEKPSSPAFTRPREEDGKQCHQNGTICCLLFLLTVHETMSLCTKHAISFKRKLHQNMSNSKSVLNFYLFFQVYNLNLRINLIASLTNSIVSPEVGRLFHFSPWF
jgi:hypothetical protein